MATESSEKISEVVRYSVNRLINMVNEVAVTGDQLHAPELLDKWLPGIRKKSQEQVDQFCKITGSFRNSITKQIQEKNEQEKYLELLDFIHEEVLHTRSPRKFLIESALQTLQNNPVELWKLEIHQLNQIITKYFQQIEETEEN